MVSYSKFAITTVSPVGVLILVVVDDGLVLNLVLADEINFIES